jgi:hypothetical protein
MNLPKKQILQELISGRSVLEIVTAYGYEGHDAEKVSGYAHEAKALVGHAEQKTGNYEATMKNPAVVPHVRKDNSVCLDLFRGVIDGGTVTRCMRKYTEGRPEDLTSYHYPTHGDCVVNIKKLLKEITGDRAKRVMSGYNQIDIDPYSAKMGADCLKAGLFGLFRRSGPGVLFYTACCPHSTLNTKLREDTAEIFGKTGELTVDNHISFVREEAAKAGCRAEPIEMTSLRHPGDTGHTGRMYRISFLVTPPKNKWK